MDPLSVAANVVAVVEGLSMTIKLIRKIIALKNAPNEVLELVDELSTLQAMLRAVAVAVESFMSPPSAPMQDCLGAVDSIRSQAVEVVTKLSAALPSLPDHTAVALNENDNQRKQKPTIRFGPALKAVLMNGKRIQELRAQIRGISTSLSAALIATNSVQINEMRRHLLMATEHVVQNRLLDGHSLSTKIDCVLQQTGLEGSESTGERTNDCTAMTDKSYDYRRNLTDAMSNTLVLSASLAEPCRPFCPCQCHKTTHLRSPTWFDAVFGSFTFSTNTTTSLSRRECNAPRVCKRSGRLSARFLYYAPYWALARAFSVMIRKSNIGGINTDLAFRAPRVLPRDSKIFACVANGSVEMVRDMIVKGEASIYDVDDRGTSLLCLAATYGDVQVCKLLLAMGADRMSSKLDGTRTYMVPVNYFVLADESQMLYSEKGVASEMRALFWDEETQNDLDLSPLHQALLSQDTPLQESHVQLFSAYLNARNAAGVTPLMWAARRGDARSLRLLLEHGADPNLKSRNSATALHYAANYGTEACVRLLLEYGAAPCVPEQSNMQPIHCVWSNLRHGECPRGKTEALLQYGADINARGYEGMTPITQVGHIRGDASALDAVNIVRYLIEAGADMDAENDEGLRVVDYAVAGGNALLVRYLLGIGAELGLKPSGKSTSIIHMAAMSAGVEMWGILKDLVQQGSFPDLERHFVDSDQLTPWHVFENCRYQYGYGDWQNYEAERGKFAELMDAVERAMPTKPVYLVPPPRRDTLINVVQ